MLVKTLTGFHPFLRSRISGTSYSWVVRSFSHCQSSLFKESQEHTPIQRIFLLCWALSTACSSAGLAEVSLPEAQRQGRWGLPAGAPTLQDPRPPPARSGRPPPPPPAQGGRHQTLETDCGSLTQMPTKGTATVVYFSISSTESRDTSGV